MCAPVSDPHAKPWLADDPNFLASLNDLDRGLIETEIGGDEDGHELMPPAEPPQQAPPAARPSAAGPARSGDARAVRAINPGFPLDRARVPDTAPPRPLTPPAPPPALAFTRPSPIESRVRRPLLDLFPVSALQPEGPPTPALGTAVGPQLPPRRPRPAPQSGPDAPPPLDARTCEAFYGLREKPFSLSTDPRFQYQSSSYERAGQEILGALRTRAGPTVLTGLTGMGKTTLCRALVHEIDRRTVTSLVLEPLRSLDDLLRTLLTDFGVMAREDLAGAAHLSREMLTGTLNSFLDSLVPLQASAVVFIDEAQNAPAALLGDLAALLGGSATGVLQLVLVGQPALTALLQHADLRVLNASVARRTELGPLAADEISSYVTHRLSVAGARTRIEFDEAAIALLFALSGGSPRVVNLLCDRALTRGHAASAGVIDAGLIEAAAADLDLEASDAGGAGVLGSMLIAAAFALLVMVGAAGALWVSRDAVSRMIQQWEDIPLLPGGPVLRLPAPIAPMPPPADVQ